MHFTVHPTVWSHFPGMRLAVVVAAGIDNGRDYPAIREEWAAAWAQTREAAQALDSAQAHPHVVPWRSRFQALGISSKKFPTSIEAVLRRVLKGGGPFFINPVVDFYNTVSLRYVVPAGGFDLAGLPAGLELRPSREGDSFQALDEEAPAPIPPGEVTYAVGATVLTRHFVWRQARAALITPATRDLFLVSEVLGELGPDLAGAVLDELGEGLRRHFRVEPRRFLMDETDPAIAW